MPIRVNRYHSAGFFLYGNPSPIPIFRVQIVNAETVTRGYIVWQSSGEATTAAYTAFSVAMLGVCQATVDNSSDGEYADIIPPLPHLKFIVPSGDELLDQANVGTLVDLHDVGSIDPSDTTPVGYGFKIEEIDVATAAIAANQYGYAMGHFESVQTS